MNMYRIAIAIGVLITIASVAAACLSPQSVDPPGTAALCTILGFAGGALTAAGLYAELDRRWTGNQLG